MAKDDEVRPRFPGNLRPSLDTLAITAGRRHGQAGTSLNPPLELASNFRHGSEAIYSREDGTATWQAFEAALGSLEGGQAVSFASGMAAASAVLDLVPVSGLVVAANDAYSGVLNRLRSDQERGRWRVRFVDATRTEEVIAALDEAALLWLESPSNPLLQVSDLKTLCRAASENGALSVVDNTFATPVLQQPLALGADLVLHSATKFIGGHSDLLMGALVTRDEELLARLLLGRKLSGGTPGGLESFLALRGLRTMPLRVRRAQETAGLLAKRLVSHGGVRGVRYPGLPTDPGHEMARRQMEGFGALISFEVRGTVEETEAFCSGLKVIEHATSLGSVESSLERRARHGGSDHVPPTLIRLSVGCEDPEDLWVDLDESLGKALGVGDSSPAGG